MYTPPHFEENDPARLAALIHRHSFATVVSHDGSSPFATHMPVLYHADAGRHGTMISHMARANPQWRQFADGLEVLVIFHGPHGYVSPSWYASQPAVPTWNYAVVHAYGIPRIIDDPSCLRVMLRELVAAFESHRPKPYGAELTDAYLDNMARGIVGFEVPVTRLEGKFKLSQNRSPLDQEGVIAALEHSPDQTEREVAEMMKSLELRQSSRPPLSPGQRGSN
jgi:transcriptional regulator